MRKIRVVLLTISISFLFIFGLVLFDYIYFPLISPKAEKAAEKYLEEKYKEDFIIDDSSYSKQLGENAGIYDVYSHPARDPDLTVNIFITDDMRPVSDDYLDNKWRSELNEQFGSLYKELYESPENYSYLVNVSFPDDIYTKYNSSNTYQEIFEKEHPRLENIIFANILLDTSNEVDDELDKVFRLIQQLKSQELKRFTLYIAYYNESLKRKLSDEDKKLDYLDFSRKHLENRVNVFDFSYDSRDEGSKKRLDNIESSADLKQYLQKEEMR